MSLKVSQHNENDNIPQTSSTTYNNNFNSTVYNSDRKTAYSDL